MLSPASSLVSERKVFRQAWRATLLRTADNTVLRDWLRDRGSLTARLQSRGDFSLRVLSQRLCRPTADEAAMLGIEPQVLARVREVALSCDGQLVVFAHTVLPYRPRGVLTVWLARLGARSLGALLFSHVGCRRGAMQFRRIDHRHALFAHAQAVLSACDHTSRTLWARRSYFSFGAQSVLVTEVFSARVRHLDHPGAGCLLGASATVGSSG